MNALILLGFITIVIFYVGKYFDLWKLPDLLEIILLPIIGITLCLHYIILTTDFSGIDDSYEPPHMWDTFVVVTLGYFFIGLFITLLDIKAPDLSLSNLSYRFNNLLFHIKSIYYRIRYCWSNSKRVKRPAFGSYKEVGSPSNPLEDHPYIFAGGKYFCLNNKKVYRIIGSFSGYWHGNSLLLKNKDNPIGFKVEAKHCRLIAQSPKDLSKEQKEEMHYFSFDYMYFYLSEGVYPFDIEDFNKGIVLDVNDFKKQIEAYRNNHSH